jgi:hypothetical protein
MSKYLQIFIIALIFLVVHTRLFSQVNVVSQYYNTPLEGTRTSTQSNKSLKTIPPQVKLFNDSEVHMLFPSSTGTVLFDSKNNGSIAIGLLHDPSVINFDTTFYEKTFIDSGRYNFKVWHSIRINQKRYYTNERIHGLGQEIWTRGMGKQLFLFSQSEGYDNYYDRGYPELFAIAAFSEGTMSFSTVFEEFIYGYEFFDEHSLKSTDNLLRNWHTIYGEEDSLCFNWNESPDYLGVAKNGDTTYMFNEGMMKKALINNLEFLKKITTHDVFLLDPFDTLGVRINGGWPNNVESNGFRRKTYDFDVTSQTLIGRGSLESHKNKTLELKMEIFSNIPLDTLRSRSIVLDSLLLSQWKRDPAWQTQKYYSWQYSYNNEELLQEIINYHDSIIKEPIHIKRKYKSVYKALMNPSSEGEIGNLCSDESPESIESMINLLVRKKQYQILRKVSRGPFPEARVWAMRALIDCHETGAFSLNPTDIEWAKKLGKDDADIELCLSCEHYSSTLEHQINYWDNKEKYIKYFFPDWKEKQ